MIKIIKKINMKEMITINQIKKNLIKMINIIKKILTINMIKIIKKINMINILNMIINMIINMIDMKRGINQINIKIDSKKDQVSFI